MQHQEIAFHHLYQACLHVPLLSLSIPDRMEWSGPDIQPL